MNIIDALETKIIESLISHRVSYKKTAASLTPYKVKINLSMKRIFFHQNNRKLFHVGEIGREKKGR